MTSQGIAYQVLIVDDDVEMLEDLQELLKEELEDLGEIVFTTEQDFSSAENLLAESDFDLVILDVRDAADRGSSADIEGRGRELYQRIAKIRWVPVVFFTGVPQQVRALEKPPLITVVTKNEIGDVAPAVREGLLSGVPALTRRISGLVERRVREFMRDVVAPHWTELAGADQREIAPVIINRLAAWLRGNGLHELDNTVDGDLVDSLKQPSAARVYLMPPVVTHHLSAADLLLDLQGCWWLVLTPTCDLYEDHPSSNVRKPRKAKAQYVRLAKADRIFTDDASGSESPPIAAWLASAKSGKDKPPERVFRTDDNRYRALPGYLDVPDLVIDFENVRSVELAEVRTWKQVATLDSPFAEAMLTSYSRSVGRVGTPDISFDAVERQLLLMKAQPAATPTQMPAGTSNSEVTKD